MYRATTSLRRKTEKKVKDLEEIIIRCQRFCSYYHHMICNHNFYSFDTTNPGCKYGAYALHRHHTVHQVPPPLVIGLDDNLYTEGIHGHVCVSQKGVGSDHVVGSIQLFFLQSRIQPNIALIFQGTVKRITYV